MEAHLRGHRGPNLNLPRQRPGVALQASIRHVQDEVPGRERSAGWIGADGCRRGLPVSSAVLGSGRQTSFHRQPCQERCALAHGGLEVDGADGDIRPGVLPGAHVQAQGPQICLE